MFGKKKEEQYIVEIQKLYQELNKKENLIFELLEQQQELQQEIFDKNTKILELMKTVVKLRTK